MFQQSFDTTKLPLMLRLENVILELPKVLARTITFTIPIGLASPDSTKDR